MKKNLTAIISFLLTLTILTGSFFAFAEELDNEGIILNSDNCTVVLSSVKYAYSGKAFNPTVTVTYKGDGDSVKLAENTDYTVTYKNNTNPGLATASVQGINDYAGIINANYSIVPAKVTDVSSKEVAIFSLTVSWTKAFGADGYDVALYKPNTSKWAHYNVDSSADSYKAVNLLSHTKYTFKVRAYKIIDGKKEYAAYSDALELTTKYAVGTPKIDGYCNLTSNPVISWNNVKNTTNYVVYRSVYKDKGYKELARVASDKKSYTDKSAKVHKTYYYRVKSMRKYKGSELFGKVSDTVSVKAKKTVFVGDSIMEGVQYYKGIPGASYVVKIGMGTYTFYERNYFKANGTTVTGVEKVISMKPDRIFIMLGMNETAYKSNAGIIEYYEYALEDFQDELKGVEIVILPVSPTKANSGKSIPKKKRILSFNKAIKAMAKEYKCKYYDYTAPFKDANGNLLNKYDGGDGCHWNPSACKVFKNEMLKYAKTNK